MKKDPVPIPSPDSPAGRPRDPRIDRAVIRATEELVVEMGYADLTIGAIAERAGTTKPAIYRRWPSKAHLVHEAVLPSGETTVLPETGSLATDIRTMVNATAQIFTRPVARAALPGLLAEVAADPALHAALLDRFRDGVWGAMRMRVVRAIDAGEARADLDPDTLIEVIGGATLLALLVRQVEHLDAAWVDATTTLVLNGIIAPTPSARG